MSGFDQEVENGSVPGLYFMATKVTGRNRHSADLLPAQSIMPLLRTPGFQRTLWPFELASSVLCPDHHFSVHSFLKVMLLIDNLLKRQEIIKTHNLFCKRL